MQICIKYTAKWQIKNNPKYKWTTCKKLVNTKTGKEVAKTRFGNSNKVGYYIDGIFIKYQDLKRSIELIPKKVKAPF